MPGEAMARAPTALAALRSRSGLRRVLAAYGLYDLVEAAAWLAVVLWAYARGGAELAGFAAVVQLLPAAVVGPLIASAGDRISRTLALLLAHAFVAVTTGLTWAALATGSSVVVVLIASTLCTTSVAVVRPIHYAALPQLADRADELVSANALSSAGEQLGLLVGPVAAGVLVAVSGPSLVLAATFVASLLGTLLCLGLPPVAPSRSDDDSGFGAALRGLRSLRGDWPSLALLSVMTVSFLLQGALDVLGVAFADQALGVGASGAGLIVGATGIGGVIGAAGAAWFAGRRALTATIVGAALVTGAAYAAVSGTRAVLPAVLLIAVAGSAAAVYMVCSRTLLQRATDESVLSRVFAVQESMALLGLAVGAALVPVLVSHLGAAGAFLPLGLGAALVVLLAAVLLRRLDARATYRPHEVALLRSVPFFSVLPEYELERLAAHATWLTVHQGQEVVRQTAEGHDFYVIESGRYSVTVDGVLKDHVLEVPGSFGEIALLRSIRRTASVTALTEGALLVVGRNDFLAAVTGNVDGRTIAAEVAAGHLSRDRTPSG
jgi:MFS family permease